MSSSPNAPVFGTSDVSLLHFGNKCKGASIRRAKLLIRQPRIKKDSESLATPTEEDPSTSSKTTPTTYTRQISEPLPIRISNVPQELLMIRKQVSHPLHSNTIKVSGTVTPLVVSNVMLSASEIKSETKPRADHETITCESDLPPTSTGDPQLDFRENTSEIYDSLRSSHCPAIRSGPALSCNFCWNTVDDHGRILRRKTKYHCPECQANLCIVPCFHEYHERNPITS